MILSNVELHKALDDGRLVISPEPQPRFVSVGTEHCPYDTHSVDLRLGDGGTTAIQVMMTPVATANDEAIEGEA